VQGLTTYNAVKNYAYTIAGQNITPGTGSPISNKTLMGEGTPGAVTDWPTADEADKQVNIALNAITSRFEIGAVKKGTGIENVQLVGVWINNYFKDGSKLGTPNFTLYPSNSTYWVTSPATSASPSANENEFDNVSITTAYDPQAYYNEYNSGVDHTLGSNSKVYAYHLFSGSIVPHVVMLVKGEYADGYHSDGKKYFLGWVTFNKFLDNDVAITSILPNYIYKIGVGTTGVEINAPDITEKPEQTNFDLGVKVTITPWTEKHVTPQV
jgi:hypothetical protein